MTLIGRHTRMQGVLHSDEDLMVAGKVEGIVVTCKGMHIYAGAVVRGRVEVQDLFVEGDLQGQVEVANRLRVRRTARVNACVKTRFVDWEEGACLDGDLTTTC